MSFFAFIRAAVLTGAWLAGLWLAGAPALAAESKPDIAIKTKAVDISVRLDPEIKANAALAADCLAEGQRWADKQRKETDAGKRVDPKSFPENGYTFERSYAATSVIGGRYISVLRKDYADTHGAHPNAYVNTILWDNTQKKRISIRPFFKETDDDGPTLTAMRKAIIAALQTEKKNRGAADDDSGIDWYQDLKPSLLSIGPVTLEPSTEPGKSAGLNFHYEPYAVGPYAEGSFEVVVHWEALKPYLSPEGAAIFGGSQPGDGGNNKQ